MADDDCVRRPEVGSVGWYLVLLMSAEMQTKHDVCVRQLLPAAV